MKKTKIIEVSKVIQGEGKYSGIPHILIRMSGCNLRCAFSDSICDAHYASWKPEDGSIMLLDVDKVIKANKHIHHFLITGGEPTFNPSLLKRIVKMIKVNNKLNFITVETNGTRFVEEKGIDFWSISPKLSNSIPIEGKPTNLGQISPSDVLKHRSEYHQPKVVEKIVNFSRGNFQLKFVISNTEDVEEAIKYLHKVFIADSVEIAKSWVYFMPEGTTNESLNKRRKWLIEKCIDLGVNYSDRLQILIK